MHIGNTPATPPAPSAPGSDALALPADRVDPEQVSPACERLLLESARHLETMLCRLRYAVAGLAVTMAAVFRPSWLSVAVALLVAPLAINIYVRRSLHRPATTAEMRRLGRTVLTADVVLTSATFLAFVADPHAIPGAFMPLLVFELVARFDWRGTVIGLTISAAAIGIRVFLQLGLLDDGALRPSLLLVWVLLTVLMLVLAGELRNQDKKRLAALAERERIAQSFQEVIGAVLVRSGVSPQAASWADALDAVRRICDEHSSECESLSASVADLLVPAAREFGLTRREREIVRLLVQGNSYDRIAQMLSVSSSTVRNHLHNVRGKLGLSSREEVVAFAYAQGLVASVPGPRRSREMPDS